MPRARVAPRKQPQQDRSRATIDVLLAATARVLARDGFDRASTNRIAAAAGVSVGSLYQYFPSKEALVAALMERHLAETGAVLEAELARVAQLPLRRAAREMVETMLRVHAVDPRLHKVLTEQVPRIGRLDRVHSLEERMAELVRDYLAGRRAELRPGLDVTTAAFVVVTAVEALTHAALHRPEQLSDERFAAEATRLVVSYLEP